MVSPIHIITIGLGLAFALGLLKGIGKNFAAFLTLLGVALMGAISFQWLFAFFTSGATTEVFTAGFKPPYSINLMMGKHEAILTSMINLVGFLGGIYLWDTLKKQGFHAMLVYLVFIMGMNVIVLTRDAFNLFVFMEVVSIATAGLVILEQNNKSIQAGFKYMIATSVIAGLFLLGIIFSYYFAGSLNIDDLVNANMLAVKGGSMAAFFVLIAIVLELKPFPANGWALDVYHAASPGLSALISAASATAMYFVFYKVLAIVGDSWYPIVAAMGLLTFVGSNLLGVKQDNPNRLLGYSSLGQIGLLMAILGFKPFLGDKLEFIAFTILLTHYLAKAGLFWLAGIIKSENLKGFAALRKKPFFLFMFGTFVFALIGFPPFPSFFGKWELIMHLADGHMYGWMFAILLGSFLEGIYLFRWLGYAIKIDNVEMPDFKIEWNKIIPVGIFVLGLYIAGYYTSTFAEGGNAINFIPLYFVAFLLMIDFLPIIVKNTISIAAIAWYSFTILPPLYEQDMLRFIFAAIFLIGGGLTLIAGYAYKGKREGFYPVALLMYVGLAQIIQAENMLHFFFGWEIMTAGSYFLIIRGKRSMPHGLSYMLFSIGGAYALLAGFGMAHAGQASISLDILSTVTQNVSWIFGLLAVGFLTKTASLGLHIWLPGAHGEAESDVSPMVSAILLKAGVFGLFILMIAMGSHPEAANIAYILGWLGALTALIGNLGATFQEDAKRLLAYSSIAQLGYILFAIAIMTHLGWLTAFTYSINHFMYKAILFLTIGAVVLRVGTHNMYEMGGLIKRMPFAFIAVMIGIIALSGVPPLSGFAGKWLFYNAIIDKEWYFQGAIVFFSGIIAFLYLFKLIYSVFLGQLKDNLREVKEISVWFIIPIYTLIIGIMIFSAMPQLVLQPLGEMISSWFPNGGLQWDGTLATTALGHWNGSGVMITVMVMFGALFAWLLLLSRKAQKVEQFNIVYAAERPFRPETTHVSYNIFAGYNKALGFLVTPAITAFWDTMDNLTHSIADFFRKIYSGNGQVYVAHVVLFVVVVYFFAI
ncbi:MAG: proton-conducting transporter membrane subunit [Bacteroidota bacterium]|nr:proton-conducting transporter membrane subunit [Bacteroidota bacterium]